jgi:hypothetical protein
VKITIGEITVTEEGGAVIVSKRSIVSHQMNTMTFTGYRAADIAPWLADREAGRNPKLVQDQFPLMTAEQREFLMSGISPSEWTKVFPAPDEENADAES